MAKKTKEPANDSNIMGAVAYLFGWVTGVILYFVKKDDAYVRFHATQSIIVSLVLMAVMILLGVTIVGLLLMPFIGLGGLCLTIFLMWKAYNGEKYTLPYIGQYVEKYSKM